MNKVKLAKALRIFAPILLLGILLQVNPLYASESSDPGNNGSGEEEYNAGHMILDHIVDHYSWHIMTIDGHEVAIDLPVILYHNNQWNVFMSSRFDHGHSSYKGFKIAQEGPNAGKIVHITHENDETKLERPIDLSITKNVAALFVVAIITLLIFLSVARSYKKKTYQAPKGLQSFLEPLILFIRDEVAIASIGKEKYHKFMPYLLTLFFFIFLMNLLGLVPIPPIGGANLTGNLAVTGVMALFTLIITLASSNKNYWRHTFNTPGIPVLLKLPIPIIPVIELVGILTKPFVLMVRLFANITAGHIVLLSFVSIIFIFTNNIDPIAGWAVSPVSLLFGVFISLLELLVAFIQAYVFVLLSALYIGMAMEEEH
ncbi:MAG: F0F1 ATP synthase subunit A [Bacteroidales bacterium]|nr:F0F1 ATP synthase subunit A [Bacteroidales bacterium]MCF8332751.1 F0F1 ATP synthase subunit A [Bacteroidales bacterium]